MRLATPCLIPLLSLATAVAAGEPEDATMNGDFDDVEVMVKRP